MTSDFTPEVARAAVERGAAWLDERCPEWVTHIKLEWLDLGSPTFCVLGQTAKCLLHMPKPNTAMVDGFSKVLDALEIDSFGQWPKAHGFDLECNGDADYEVLTLTWREKIRERLEAQA